MDRYELKTETNGLCDITENVLKSIRSSGVKNGLCVVFCPHTTAGITINENSDDAVGSDVTLALSRAFPKLDGFMHIEGNSDGHAKCSVVGASETLIVCDGAPVLGRWQNIYFAEFDAPRKRQYFVKVAEC